MTYIAPLAGPGETLRQYTERRVRESAADHGVTQKEVRGLYDWYAEWWSAVMATAKAGQVLPKQTLDALDPLHRYHVAHDWPRAIPAGYVPKAVRGNR